MIFISFYLKFLIFFNICCMAGSVELMCGNGLLNVGIILIILLAIMRYMVKY